MQLTTKRVAMFAKRPGRYHDGHGLILVVVNANNASWQLRYQRNGRERWFGLGPLQHSSVPAGCGASAFTNCGHTVAYVGGR